MDSFSKTAVTWQKSVILQLTYLRATHCTLQSSAWYQLRASPELLWPNKNPPDASCVLLQNCERTKTCQISARAVYCMLLQNCCDQTQLRHIPARAVVYCILPQNCCDRTKIRQIPVACFSRIVTEKRSIRYQLEQCTTLCMLLQNCCGRKTWSVRYQLDQCTARCI